MLGRKNPSSNYYKKMNKQELQPRTGQTRLGAGDLLLFLAVRSKVVLATWDRTSSLFGKKHPLTTFMEFHKHSENT